MADIGIVLGVWLVIGVWAFTPSNKMSDREAVVLLLALGVLALVT